MGTKSKIALIMILFAACVPLAAAYQAVSSCTDLDTPGQYYQLTADIDANLASGEKCMNVTVDDVTLDCAGHTILDGGTQESGVYAESVDNMTLVNCTITGFGQNVLLDNVSGCNVSNNTLTNGQYNIRMINSFNNMFFHNKINNGYRGFSIGTSVNSTLAYNDFTNNQYAVLIVSPDCDHDINESNIAGNNNPILYIHDASDVVVENTTDYGLIHFCNVVNSTIKNNTQTNEDGVLISNCFNVSVYNNSISGVYRGIFLFGGGNNTVANNTIKTGTAIYLYNSVYNLIYNNTASGNSRGLFLEAFSYGNTAYGNDFTDTNIPVDSLGLGSCPNTVDLSNLAGDSGDPVLYVNDTSGITIENNHTLGFIFLCNVDSSLIRNITMTDDDGIRMFDCDNNTIANNTIAGGWSGLYLHHNCDYNNITNNTLENISDNGVYLGYTSQHNNASGNRMENMSLFCFRVHVATTSYNLIANNTLKDCNSGFSVAQSTYNVYRGNTLLSCGTGFGVFQAAYNKIADNSVTGGNRGMTMITSSSNNIVANNTFSNILFGIRLENSPNNNLIYNNNFTAPTPAEETNTTSPYASANDWSIAKDCTHGPNIIGGKCLGGNFYSNYTGVDKEGDGIGDTMIPYPIAGGFAEDDLPLTEDLRNVTVLKLDQTVLAASTGGVIELLINVSNHPNSNGNANFTLTDYLPEGLSYSSANPAYTSIEGDENVTWTYTASLAPGAFYAIRLNVTVDSGVATLATPILNLTNTVNATITSDLNAFNVSDRENVTIYYANITPVKLDQTMSRASQGGLVSFLLNITNGGNVPLAPVAVVDTLPQGLTFLSTNQTHDISGQAVNWTISSLAPGQTKLIQLNATLSYTPDECDDLVNNITAIGIPPNGGDVVNDDNLTFTVCEAALSAVKVDVTPAPPGPGGLVQFEINITNTGNVTLNPVRVVDTLPAGLTYLNASPQPNLTVGQTLTWFNISSLAPGAWVIIRLNATVDSGTTGTLFNSVSVNGTPPNGDNATDSDTAAVGIAAPAINVIKSASDSQVEEGDTVTFTITITNSGELNLTTVSVTDVLPAGLAYVSASTPPNETSPYVWYNLTNLTVGSSAVLTITVGAPTAGTYTNRVTVIGEPKNADNVTDTDTAGVLVEEDGPIDEPKEIEAFVFPTPPEPERPLGAVVYGLNLLQVASGSITIYEQDVQIEEFHLNVGETKDIQAKVQNTGNQLLHNVRLSASAADCLRIDEIEPSAVGVMTAGQYQYFTVTFTGVSKCEITLDLFVKSNEVSDNESISASVREGAVVTVPVKPPEPVKKAEEWPSWVLPAIVIFVLLLIILFLLWWFRATKKEEGGLRNL